MSDSDTNKTSPAPEAGAREETTSRPPQDRPMGERPMGDRPMGDRPMGDRPMGDRPMGDRPMGDRPLRDRRGPPDGDGEGRQEGDDRSPSRGGFRGRPKPFFRRKICKVCAGKLKLDYKDAPTLRRFTTDRGKILPRRITGTCAKHQRRLAQAIKRARILALLPYVAK